MNTGFTVNKMILPVRRFLSWVSLLTMLLGNLAKASFVGAKTVKASPEMYLINEC